MTIGIVEVASFKTRVTVGLRRHEDIHFETHELSGNLTAALDLSFCGAPLDDDVLALQCSQARGDLGGMPRCGPS